MTQRGRRIQLESLTWQIQLEREKKKLDVSHRRRPTKRRCNYGVIISPRALFPFLRGNSNLTAMGSSGSRAILFENRFLHGAIIGYPLLP